MRLALRWAAALCAVAAAVAQTPNTLTPEEKREGFFLLFNGKDLTGWDGDPRIWSVRDAAITGSTDKNKLEHNSFLIYKDEFADFILRFEIKLRNHNSGMQFRSKRLPDWVVTGYQADASEAGDHSAWGNFYEEKGRGRNLMQNADEGWLKAKSVVHKGDWNQYEVIARGNRVILRLNGVETINQAVDKTSAGIIAIQCHMGEAMEVQVRSVRLRKVVATATPCPAATPVCIEKFPAGPPGKYAKMYRSYALTEANPDIERALIVIHGASRDGNTAFASALAAAQIAGALDNTMIIAPRLASNHGAGCNDKLDPDEISWSCGGPEDWRGGGAAAGVPAGNTFGLVDDLLRTLARRDVFPNLRVIVVAGHSAGGQFVNRYMAATRVEKGLGVPVRYVVANPSTYLYLDDTRPAPGASCAEKGGCTGEFRRYSEGRNCTTYNQWRNGLEKKTGYASDVADEDLRRQLILRDVTYLLGEFDTLPVYGFDSSCPAMAQGPTRLARGLNYWNYLRSKYSAPHKLIVVPQCGHNGRCIYTADVSLPVIFPK